jgi:hypothetical protein
MIGFAAQENAAGAPSVELIDVSCCSASKTNSGDAKIPEPDQPHAPDRRRRFSLAVRWLVDWSGHASPSNLRQSAKAREAMRQTSWQPP